MRYLITGAQGFTGRFVCAEILRSDPAAQIVGIGRSAEAAHAFTHAVTWRGRPVAAPLTADLRAIDSQRYTYVRCALTDAGALAAVVKRAAPDRVIHLAAALRDDPGDVLVRSNAEGTGALMRALATLVPVPRLVLGSSGSVYGAPLRLPLREDERCAPHEPYAMSKLAAELIAGILAAQASIPLVIARIFNIAGPGQEERHVCGRFAAQAAAIALAGAPPSLDIGDLSPTRDFIDVRDVAHALLCLAQHGTPGEIYNVASGNEVAVGDVLALILRTARLDDKVTLVQRYARPADVPRAFADVRKLRACGFEPQFSLERTLADLYAYYACDVANAAGAQPVTSATSDAVTGTPSSQG